MKRILLLCIIVSLSNTAHWTRTARIADVDFWPDFTEEEIREGIDTAHQQGASVVMAWLTSENIDIPQKDVDALEKAVVYIHETYPDLKIMVYTAPLEIITENVDKNRDGHPDTGETVSVHHPEWLQAGMDGRKAVFYGDFEHWIGKYDEDVWCCPNDFVYRQKIKESVKRLAETGVDGIWIDVVLFLCDYGDWDSNWACHCEDCQHKFFNDTGESIPDAVTWDTTWKTWILWRQHCIEEFIDELSQTAKSVNPEIQIIVEHWHGYDAESTENAWSPIGLQTVTDVLAHEYICASQHVETTTPVNYVKDIAVYQFYRGADRGHPTWILAYSEREDGQRMLAASLLQAGCNFYDTVYPDMIDSVNIQERKRIFRWINQYSKYYYEVIPCSSVGVYYSKATIDFYDCPGDWEFYREFFGISMMLLSLHIPYTVITGLESIEQYDTVILPGITCLSDAEADILNTFLENGGYIVATGGTGLYDEFGRKRESAVTFGTSRFFFTSRLFGNEYYKEVDSYPLDNTVPQGILQEFFAVLTQAPVPQITAPDNMIVLPFMGEDTLIFRVLNLEGISPGDAVPHQQSFTITSKRPILDAYTIPFLSHPERLDTVTVQVYDHSLLLVTVEPVSIFCNEYDLPAAQELSLFLQSRCVPVQFISSLEEATSVLIVFGGHKAKKTGEFVSSLLTTDQKTLLEQSGFSNLFIIKNEKLIIVIAGNEREDTASLTKNKRRDIFKLI